MPQIAPELPIIRVIGYVSGKIARIGPDYTSLVSLPQATHEWLDCWDDIYEDEASLESLRATNEVFMARVLSYGVQDLARIQDIKHPRFFSWFADSGDTPACPPHSLADGHTGAHHGSPVTAVQENVPPRFCLGTDRKIALVPPGAAVGDLIIQFWRCSAAVIVRPVRIDKDPGGNLTLVSNPKTQLACNSWAFRIVGRADVARAWEPLRGCVGDRQECELFCMPRSSCDSHDCRAEGPVYVDMDFPMLQVITASITTY